MSAMSLVCAHCGPESAGPAADNGRACATCYGTLILTDAAGAAELRRRYDDAVGEAAAQAEAAQVRAADGHAAAFFCQSVAHLLAPPGAEDEAVRHLRAEDLPDLLTHLRERLAQARAEGEAAGVARERADLWRHIADAPRDGSRVLLYYPATQLDPEVVAEGFFDTVFDGVWMLSRGSSAMYLRVRQPTHWAPLPGPPVAGAHVAPAAGGAR